MKKLMLAVAPVVLALTACATTTGTGTGGASAQTTTQQLGVAALKVAVNAKCITEINNVAAWKTATKYMTAEQRDSIQTNVCGCVSEKAPNSVTAVELAAAVLYLFEIPRLVQDNPELLAIVKPLHIYISWFAGLLIVGHVLAALKHHFVDKDNVLNSMTKQPK